MRLQNQLQIRSHLQQVFRTEGALRCCIEGLDVRPFQARDVQRQSLARGNVLRMRAQPGRQAAAEIAQGITARRTCGQICLGEPLETARAHHRPQTGEIAGQRIQNAEPILPVVDFEPLEGSKPVIGLDEILGFRVHRATAAIPGLHAVVRRERCEDRSGHAPLNLL